MHEFLAESVISEYRQSGRLPHRLTHVDKFLYPGLQGLGISRYALWYPNDKGLHVVEILSIKRTDSLVGIPYHTYAGAETVERALGAALRAIEQPLLRPPTSRAEAGLHRWLMHWLSNLTRIKIADIHPHEHAPIEVGDYSTLTVDIPELFGRMK